MKREASLKRQAWLPYRTWSRMTSGVLLSVIGAVQYGTAKVFYKIVPHFDAQELRQYMHQVMAIFSKTDKEVVMVVDRSGIHRAHKLDATLEHYHGTLRFHSYRPIVVTTSTPLKVLARDEGHHRRRTMFWQSSAVIPAHTLGTDGASRTPHLRVSLVAHFASDFAGAADIPTSGSIRLAHACHHCKGSSSLSLARASGEGQDLALCLKRRASPHN